MTTDKIDQYRAFLHGLNVGIELMASGLNESLTEDEYREWIRLVGHEILRSVGLR